MAHATMIGAGTGALVNLLRGENVLQGAVTGGAMGAGGSALGSAFEGMNILGPEMLGAESVSVGAGTDALLADQLTQATVNPALMSPEAFAALPVDPTSAALPKMMTTPTDLGGMGANFMAQANEMAPAFDIRNSRVNDLAKRGTDYFSEMTEGMDLGNVGAELALAEMMKPQEQIQVPAPNLAPPSTFQAPAGQLDINVPGGMGSLTEDEMMQLQLAQRNSLL